MGAGRRRFLLAATIAGATAAAGCAGPGHRDGPRDPAGTPGDPRLEVDALPAADLSAAATARLLRGDPGAAAALYERAVGREEAGGDRTRLAVDLSSLALAYDMLDRRDEAGRTYRRALPLLKETLGPDHPEVARCLANLSALYWREGAAAEARPLAARALAIAEASLGPDHPKTALARRNLALMATGTIPEPPPPARDDAVPVAVAAGAARGSAVTERAGGPVEAVRGAPGRGRFAVQLAAVRERSEVAAAWRRLAAPHPGLAGLEPRPPRAVETVGGGTLYRVMGGDFATEGEARDVCERVRAEGGDCQVAAL
jgi:tetratricopeptide (TPR) repeat protein